MIPAAVLLTGSLTACSSPCESIPPGTEEQKQLVQDGFELEREKSGTECVMQPDGSWTRD
jgi:hypothetical protein